MDHSFLYTKKLLLVDDEPELLELVSVILKEEGFENIMTTCFFRIGRDSCRQSRKT